MMLRPNAMGGAGPAAGPGAHCDAMLLGREPVEGAVHATALASLVRGLAGTKARPNRQGRRFLLRCSEAGVELVARRPGMQRLAAGSHGAGGRADDEGFESDDDRRSTRSDDSNSVSSSCCLVEDHVFKAAVAPGLAAGLAVAGVTTSSTSSDSANSSGGSDTDEVDGGKVREPVVVEAPPPPAPMLATSLAATLSAAPARETFSFHDVAFCHVDAAFPRVVVLVVRRAASTIPRRLRASGRDVGPGLEALVLECRSEESLRALCAAYQDLSRRARLDGQFRSPHRRKDADVTPATAPSAGPLPKFIFSKVDEVTASSGPTGPSSLSSEASTASRFNLVHRTDGDGVTHIEVSRGEAMSGEDVTDDLCGPSSIISISTPDAGNILASKDRDRARVSKEIEGVIRADVESALSRREVGLRQRHLPDEPKLWTTALTADDGPSSLPPPQRPERKRFVRKNKAPAPPTPSAPTPDPGVATLRKQKTPSPQDAANNTLNRVVHAGRAGSEQRVVRGQFIRVSVDQQQHPVGWPPISHFPAGWTGPPPSRTATPHPWHRYQRRSRSSDSGRGPAAPPGSQPRSRSPPLVPAVARRPMAYRYIDTPGAVPATAPARPHTGVTTNSLSNRFFGLSQKLREIGGSVVGGGYPGSGRRNSWGDSPTRFYTSLEPPLRPGGNNLKSVIKKNHAAGAEPKKVTFSAYATVQVVD